MGFAKHSNTPSLALTSHVHSDFQLVATKLRCFGLYYLDLAFFCIYTSHSGMLYKCTPTHSGSVCVGVLVNGCGLDPPEAGGKLPTQPL